MHRKDKKFKQTHAVGLTTCFAKDWPRKSIITCRGSDFPKGDARRHYLGVSVRPTAVIREVVHERLQSADTVEKLQIFPDGKIIYAVTISKFSYTGREPKLSISSDRTTGELTY